MFNKYQHPKSGVSVLGMLLVNGATLCAEDVYDSTSGKWEPCPIPGIVLGNTQTLWVRPRDLTLDERNLLKYLAKQPKGSFDCIAKKPSDIRQFMVVPGPNYNWDSRINTPEVLHPECIQPLQDIGFLAKDPHSHGHGVEFYVLTDVGRAAAMKIAA